MGHRCFISFKTEDKAFKTAIQENKAIDMIDHSLDDAINSSNVDYVMRKIREEYLCDSTVTIYLIGKYSGENRGYNEQQYIKRELQASLYHSEGNTQNGILGIVLPEMYATIFTGNYICSNCGNAHYGININDETTVKEFSVNFYVPEQNRCSWPNESRYCVLVKWSDFVLDPNKYIDEAFDKRTAPIANRTVVYP